MAQLQKLYSVEIKNYQYAVANPKPERKVPSRSRSADLEDRVYTTAEIVENSPLKFDCQCGATISGEANIKKHKKVCLAHMKAENKPTFKCESCGKEFSLK